MISCLLRISLHRDTTVEKVVNIESKLRFPRIESVLPRTGMYGREHVQKP